MNGRVVYLDTSAFVKLVSPEPQSPALRAYLRTWPVRVSAALLCTEALRAASRVSAARVTAVRRQLRRIVLIGMDRALLERAGTLGPPGMRSLDAIRVAAALSLGPDLGEVITYDDRMAEAARAQGLSVTAPA
jgi:predicted nucleic acid-binding protein